jgi:transcriptional regulator with XRE-family HTH domain
MSQTQLGEMLGITFQQLQKNENGTNRLGCSRLFRLSQALDVPVSYFFEDIPTTLSAAAKSDAESQPCDSDIVFKRETLKLVRAYYRIEDEKVRRQLRSPVMEVGDGG